MSIATFAAGAVSNQDPDVVRWTGDPYTITDTQESPPAPVCYADVEVRTDGSVWRSLSGIQTQIGTWYAGVGDASEYQVQLSGSGDSLDTSGGRESDGVYYAMSENRVWGLRDTSTLGSALTWNGTLHVRRGTGADVDTATITISAHLISGV